MKKIIPITDLQRQAGQIIGGVTTTDEPVVITHRGRAAAVVVSARRYTQIERDLERLDELELLEAVTRSREAIARGETISHAEVKRRLEKRKNGKTLRKRRAR
ncbi:MAG TPA: type II toxin-antitoxin system Phd/YefM family antitoxin [Blastocatellia bacterium]|nr:type II toxin-antitoxin system Phd/YefM family antitoxin [Blastocatellia bacterium]